MSTRPRRLAAPWPRVLGVAMALTATAARAEGAAAQGALRIDVEGCAALFPTAEVERIMALERPVRAPAVPVHAVITCTGSIVTMSVAGPELAGTSERSGDIGSSSPLITARLVALGLAELIAIASARVPPEASIEPAPAPPIAIASAPPPPPAPAAAVSLAGGLAGFTSGLANLPTAAVRLLGPWRPGIAASVGLDVSRADRAADLGTVDAWLGSLTAGPAWVVGNGRWRAVGALGARVGHVWMRGRSQANGVVTGALSGVFWGPDLDLTVSRSLSKRLFVAASASAGYVAWPLRGRIEGQDDFAVEGFWGMARLGIGITTMALRPR